MQLLAAAGYPNGLEVASHYITGPERDQKRFVEPVDGMTADGGIRVKVTPVDYAKEYIPLYRDGQGQYEGWAYHTVGGGVPTSISPVSALAAAYWSKSGSTFKGFSTSGNNDKAGDPQLDALIEKTRLERDTEKRRLLMFDLQRQLGKSMYGMILPGGGTGFTMAWPALGNFRVYRSVSQSGTVWSQYREWIDESKPPFKSA
jgi:ABC-type transport system substrate-binding protein